MNFLDGMGENVHALFQIILIKMIGYL